MKARRNVGDKAEKVAEFIKRDMQKLSSLKTQGEEVVVFMTLIIILTQKLRSRLRRQEGGEAARRRSLLINFSIPLPQQIAKPVESSALNAASVHFYCVSQTTSGILNYHFSPLFSATKV